jgi:hypothetical protein
LEPGNRARVEAWLRYGSDLGLGPYYRDRAVPETAVMATPGAGVESLDQPSQAMAAAAGQTDAGSTVAFRSLQFRPRHRFLCALLLRFL